MDVGTSVGALFLISTVTLLIIVLAALFPLTLEFQSLQKSFASSSNTEQEKAKSWFEKGNEFMEAQDYEQAIEAYEESIASDPFENAWFNKGVALSSLGRYDEAVVAYNEALKINPDSSDTLENKAIALGEIGRFEEELELYDRLLEENAKDPSVIYNKAGALDDLGRYEEAVEYYDKALEIDPQFVDAWNNKGLSLKHLERYDDAIVAFDKAIALDPYYQNAISNRELTLNSLNESSTATTLQSDFKLNNSRNTDFAFSDSTSKTGTVYMTIEFEPEEDVKDVYNVKTSEVMANNAQICPSNKCEFLKGYAIDPLFSNLSSKSGGKGYNFEGTLFVDFSIPMGGGGEATASKEYKISMDLIKTGTKGEDQKTENLEGTMVTAIDYEGSNESQIEYVVDGTLKLHPTLPILNIRGVEKEDDDSTSVSSKLSATGENTSSVKGETPSFNTKMSNETEAEFLTFVDNKTGVSIQYPSEWTEESFSNLTDDEIVPIVVISPPISRDPNANTFLEIGYDRSIQANNFSLDEYVRGVIRTQQSNSEISDFKVDSVKTDTIFANRSAYTLVSLRDADGISMKSFEVGTLIGEKLYYALFETEESKFNVFIPEVKKMVDSFELISDEVASIYENDKITEVETTQSGDASSDDNSNTSFLSYENSKYGIRIQYPSSWTYENVRSNSGDELVDIVYFYPPSDPASAFGSGNVTIGYYDHIDENPTLEKFVDDHTEAYNSLGGLLGGKMDGKTDAMLAGRQAYSLVTTTTEDGTDGKSIEVGTFVGNKRHFIYFDAEKQDYNTLLPDVQKMIDSFEITVDPDKKVNK